MDQVIAMALVFDPAAHTYALDGVTRPSVTQILRASGLIDFSQIPKAILEAARRRGTKVHEAVHYWNECDLDVADFSTTFPDYAGYLQSWIQLVDTGRLKTILCEHRVASRKYDYCGTIDWLGEFDGRGALMDFATGDPEDAAKDLQTGAYLLAAQEWSLEPEETTLRTFFDRHPFVGRFAVRLKKDGSLPTPEPYRDPADSRLFLTLLSAQSIIRVRRPKAMDWSQYAA